MNQRNVGSWKGKNFKHNHSKLDYDDHYWHYVVNYSHHILDQYFGTSYNSV